MDLFLAIFLPSFPVVFIVVTGLLMYVMNALIAGEIDEQFCVERGRLPDNDGYTGLKNVAYKAGRAKRRREKIKDDARKAESHRRAKTDMIIKEMK